MKKNVIGKRGELIQKVATFVFVRPTEAFIGCSSIFSLVAAAGGACIVLAGTERCKGTNLYSETMTLLIWLGLMY